MLKARWLLPARPPATQSFPVISGLASGRRFTAVVPTPHASSGQRPGKTKRANTRSYASVVTRKRRSLNRAEKRRTKPNLTGHK